MISMWRKHFSLFMFFLYVTLREKTCVIDTDPKKTSRPYYSFAIANFSIFIRVHKVRDHTVLALHVHRSPILELVLVAENLRHLLGRLHDAGHARRVHARRHIDGVAPYVVQQAVCADDARRDRSRVKSHPYLELEVAHRHRLVVERLQLFVELEREIDQVVQVLDVLGVGVVLEAGGDHEGGAYVIFDNKN